MSSFSFTSSAGMISVTFMMPVVIVPVLSSAAICVRPVCSRDAEVLNRIPDFAATPLPTIMATGVASPNAHGQLITRTETARAIAYPTVCPAMSQTTKVMTAIAITTGTKMPETLSAIFAIGALVAAASLTIRMICESVVSSPTLAARQTIKPDVLIVAEVTASPTVFSTGILSPVKADSFTAL